MVRVVFAFLLLPLTLFADYGSWVFGNISARSIGPAVMGGRVSDLAAIPSNPVVIYVGSASGGLWKSKDGGITFSPIFDKYPQSIGAIAIDPNDSETVWVGTGEPWTRNSVSVGKGVYKSTDGGKSWKFMGLEDTERIAKIIVHPENSKIVYVCALGHLWNDNEERGVYKTVDGGKSWKKILYVDQKTGCSDMAIDPQEPEILYVGMWEFRRWPWFFKSGGPGSGLYKSLDGGKNWTLLKNGFPEKPWGRIAVAVAPSRPSRVYVLLEDDKGTALYRSDDFGNSFVKVNEGFNIRVRPFYFARLIVDPVDYNIVYKPGISLTISRDGGESFAGPFGYGGTVHPDHHALWINPKNPKHLILGTDGGVYESFDRGDSWRHLNNLPISQVYRVGVDNEFPYNVYVGLQDNGSWRGPSMKLGFRGVLNKHWETVGFGDGFWSFAHPKDSKMVFSEYQGGKLVRVDMTSGELRSITPHLATGEKLRFNWNTPFLFGPSGTLYVGAQFLFRSLDNGESWEKISPDLTTNDPEKQKQHLSGGMTVDNTTAENHTTIYSISESPIDSNVIWVGSDDGLVHVTTNGGKEWIEVTPKSGVPKNTWVSFIESSNHKRERAYVTFDGHRTGDMNTYLFVTDDMGKSWRKLPTEGVEGYAYVVKEDPVNEKLLFLGTEFGLYISIDGGESWARFKKIPKVSVRHMVIHPRGDLVVGTHGRGVYIIDDLSPLRALTPELLSEEVVILPSRDGVQYLMTPLDGWGGADEEFLGDNPPDAAFIHFFQKKRHLFGSLKMEVYDSSGNLVISLPVPKNRGIVRVLFPMRLPPPKVPPGNSLLPAMIGPYLMEGEYTFKLVKGNKSYEGKISLVKDPRNKHSESDRKLQQQTVLELYYLLEDLGYLADTLKYIEDQAADILKKKKLKQVAKIKEEALALRKELVATHPAGWLSGEEKLREKIGELYMGVIAYLGRPTKTQLSQLDFYKKEFSKAEKKFNDLVEKVKAVNRKIERSGFVIKILSKEEWREKREKI